MVQAQQPKKELGFVPKPTPADESLGALGTKPILKMGGKHLANTPLLLEAQGGLSLYDRAGGNSKLLRLDPVEGKVLMNGKELSEKDPLQKQALRDLAWYLIQRYPKTDYTKLYLKRYFDLTLPSAMSEEEKKALHHPFLAGIPKIKTGSHGDGGLSAGGLPFDGGRPDAPATKPSFEQLESFYEDPSKWTDGVCSREGKCSIVNEELGAMEAPEGIKKLMVHEEDLKKTEPVSSVAKSSSGTTGVGESVFSKSDFEAKFKAAPEQEAWVLFSADDCGPCQNIKSQLAAGTKRTPEGVKLYLVQVPSYRTSLPEGIRGFKGGGGFPQVVKFTKNGDSLTRKVLASGEMPFE